MLLELSTWCEVKEYLKTKKEIIIPVGSTEQHGPMGLMGTDFICPEFIARGVSDRTKTLVAPTLTIGMSQHHLAFPGSITLRPTTLIAVIKDVIHSLSGHGFTHLFFLNGHGGNVDSVKTAFSEVYAEHSFSKRPSPVHLHLCNWYGGKRLKKVQTRYFKTGEGSHATPTEISLSFYAHPGCVKKADLAPRIAPNHPFRDSSDFSDKFPDGRIGSDSSLASAEIGKEICEAAVRDVLNAYELFLNPNIPV
ncbi:MAG: creatininase family protein [Desulfobacterales bacterium]|nr:creatininase family protein [Desulfobacterales bacterium]